MILASRKLRTKTTQLSYENKKHVRCVARFGIIFTI